MAKVVIKKERCKACEFCIAFCPRQILVLSDDLNSRGVHFASVIDEEKCTGCAICGLVCPDMVIEVYR